MSEVSVLVVEDNELWQRIILDVLSNYDCRVDAASDYDTARRKLDGSAYDMVTLDMALSAKEEDLTVTASGGWRLLVYRLTRDFPGTAIFVISASFKDQLERIFDLNEYGVKGFITKDKFDPETLEEWVKKVRKFKEAGGRPVISRQELRDIYSSRPDVTTQELLDLYKQQLVVVKRNKADAELQKAKYGPIDAPPRFNNIIKECDEEIERIEAEIAKLS